LFHNKHLIVLFPRALASTVREPNAQCAIRRTADAASAAEKQISCIWQPEVSNCGLVSSGRIWNKLLVCRVAGPMCAAAKAWGATVPNYPWALPGPHVKVVGDTVAGTYWQGTGAKLRPAGQIWPVKQYQMIARAGPPVLCSLCTL